MMMDAAAERRKQELEMKDTKNQLRQLTTSGGNKCRGSKQVHGKKCDEAGREEKGLS